MTAWWIKRLLESRHPLREKLTLFWHNHFATSNAKVNDAGAMIGMYRLLYRHALGSFSTLLHEITHDPAMLVWLDTTSSVRGKPNENYARELMELFSLGIGHYSERDIREAARAFTGYVVRSGRSSFEPARHDPGEKVVLGKAGPFRAEEVVDLCLQQSACPTFITSKLFRFLISETLTPSAELLAPLAEEFRDGYHFGRLVERMLRSNLFFSDHAYRSRIKSPVDFAVGTVRALEGQVSATALASALEGLGQRLGYPPSVKGWDGGPAWLNAQTLLFRHNLALALTSTEDDRFRSRCDPAALVRKRGRADGPQPVEFLLDLLLQGDAGADARPRLTEYLDAARRQKMPAFWTEDQSADRAIRATCYLILTRPEYQLD
jgi:uncharacterized protein (DUF1800 family)